MASSTPFYSYELNGEKLSFANWISMISPDDAPFTAMTGKEAINETVTSWQTDVLAPVNTTAVLEGSDLSDDDISMGPTTTNFNYTQIFRRGVSVSDTANVVATYGRGREIQYQMEKAGKALKRDIETVLLAKESVKAAGSSTGGTDGKGIARTMDGFYNLVNAVGATDGDTGAIVHKSYATEGGLPDEASLFDLTAQLYTAGSDADIIMIPPAFAGSIAGLQEDADTRVRIFENTKQFIKQVNTITDPLGQTYKVIVNRWMPADCIYFFNASDFTQMVLRAPKRIELAKTGSAQNWMIEAELSLRLRNPSAAGIAEFTVKA